MLPELQRRDQEQQVECIDEIVAVAVAVAVVAVVLVVAVAMAQLRVLVPVPHFEAVVAVAVAVAAGEHVGPDEDSFLEEVVEAEPPYSEDTACEEQVHHSE